MTDDARTPVHVLTGFLGSGKTTLLRALLAAPGFADTAVLINELGEIGLDHLLAGAVSGAPVLLPNGCVCCTIRGDLRDAVRDLQDRRAAGTLPPFRRVIIETTGLADPLPVLATIASDRVLRHHFRLGATLATLDGLHGGIGFAEHPELAAQIATADRVIITKTDLATAAAVAHLRDATLRVNPTAFIVEAVRGAADPALLLDVGDSGVRLAEPARVADGAAPHAGDIRSFTITLDTPVDWTAFGLWLSLLAHRHGERLLRFKAILDIAGSHTPVAVHAVRQMVHPPEHLVAWPASLSDDHEGRRRSVLVFIGRALEEALVRRSLTAFLGLGAAL